LWKRLHQLIYFAGILVVIHYIWVVKSDLRTPLLYGAIVIFLLIARIPAVRRWAVSIRNRITGKIATGGLRKSED
jgi:DMSO/TMAO reductase YedYZ heme-binding membrane subunit